jgi:hypothetical protein
MRQRITVLPDEDFRRLREIADSGTVEGNADTLVILKYLASALVQVAEGQKQTPEAFQKLFDAAGLGR